VTDPRFDPAFQRGYDGPDPELVIREQAPSASAPVTSAASATPAPEASEHRRPQPDAAPEPEPRFAVRNPYRLALLLLGIAMLIAAVASLYSQVVHPQATSTTAESQFVQVLVSNLPPVLGLAGFVCLILWLALGALDRVTVDAEGDD
jgi:hypothetical protein